MPGCSGSTRSGSAWGPRESPLRESSAQNRPRALLKRRAGGGEGPGRGAEACRGAGGPVPRPPLFSDSARSLRCSAPGSGVAGGAEGLGDEASASARPTRPPSLPLSLSPAIASLRSGEELEKDCLSYFASAEILLKEDVQERSPVTVEEVQPEEHTCRMRLCRL